MHARRLLVAAMTGLVALTAIGPLRALTAHATSSVASITFSPRPKIAADASLGPSSNPPSGLLVQAVDNSSQGVPGATIYLAIQPAAGGGTATASSGGTDVPLTSGEQAFVSDVNGVVEIKYTTPATLPIRGTDTITAQNAAQSPTLTDAVTYTYNRLSSLTFSPKPMSGTPQETVTLQAGGPAPSGTDVYVKFTPASSTPPAGQAFSPAGSATAVPTTYRKYTTDANGRVTFTYLATGSPSAGGQDVLTAVDDPSADNPVKDTDSHSYIGTGPAQAITFDRRIIAKAGTLDGAKTAGVLVATASNNSGSIAAAPVTVCLAHGGGGSSSATATGASGTPVPVPACNAPLKTTTDSSGVVSIVFTADGSLAAGIDSITVAADTTAAPLSSGTDTTNYNYRRVTKFTFVNAASQHDIATPATLDDSQASKNVTFQVTAVDGSDSQNPVAVTNTFIYLSFVPAATGSTTGGSATLTASSTNLSASPHAVTVDGNGQVSIKYATGFPNPTGGKDIVFVNADDPAGSTAASIAYRYSTVDGYTFFPAAPIAPRGSLSTPGQQKTIQVKPMAVNSGTDGTVYLTFTHVTNGGTAAVGSQVLDSTPRPFASSGGIVSVVYTASTQSTFPSSGSDTLTATDATINPVTTATDSYDYASVSFSAVDTSTLASPGTLPPGQVLTPTVIGAAYPAVAYLSLRGPIVNGVRTVAVGTGSATCTTAGGPVTLQLTKDPQSCGFNPSGQISVSYTVPATLPVGGVDSLIAVATAAAADTAPPSTNLKTYTYLGKILTAVPIAAPNSIEPNGGRQVVFAAQDSAGNPLVGVPLWLSFTSTAVEPGNATTDSAAVGGQTFTTAKSFLTDGSAAPNGAGTVTVILTAGGAAQANSGIDFITAANQQNGPLVSALTSYGVRTVSSYAFGQAPPAGSLGGGQATPVTLQVVDSFGAPISGVHRVFLSSSTPGGGHFTMQGVGITGSPQAFLTAGDGTITGTYGTPNPLPASQQIDILSATDTAGGGGANGNFAYVLGQRQGYWLVASDGGIFPFGNVAGYGSTGGITLNRPIVGMAATPDAGGYWLVASDGGIFPFGDAGGYGSTGAIHLNKPIVGMASTPSGRGYWLVASDGGIFPFGDANGYGSTGAIRLNKPIVGMAATADGGGYWLVASDGGIFPFGDATGHGSTGNITLNQPIVGMAPTADGGGYWLVASDGGIFPFGDAVGHGSTGNITLNRPIVGMAPTHDGGGYWLVASDGGIFPFGDAQGLGSTGGMTLNKPIVGMAAVG